MEESQSQERIIYIFLASSIDDTQLERDKLQNKIVAVWNPIFHRFNITLEVFRCEQMTEEWINRHQGTIDEKICQSDIFIVIFKNKVGNYTFHEFEVACKSNADKKRPHIYPYVSNKLMTDKDTIPELQELTKNSHYLETFDVIDTIEISLLERLGKELSLCMKTHMDGSITINGKEANFNISPQEINKAYLITQKEYIDFAVRLFEREYPGISFVQYKGQKFPDTILVADDSVRNFDKENFDFSFHECSTLLQKPTTPIEPSTLKKLEEKYHIRKNSAVMPYKFYDYMSDEVLLDDSGKIVGLKTFVGSDEDNVFSTLTLRDEFENFYEALKDNISNPPPITRDNFPLRTSVHEKTGKEGVAPIICGAARSSAIGIQVMTLFPVQDWIKKRDRNVGRFADGAHLWTPLIKRSEKAREQPGFYQFAPCGGFRIFDEPEASAKDRNIQEEHFDYFRAILHHYVRELFNETTGNCENFGDSRFDKPAHAALSDAALESTHAQELCDMLSDGRADLEFLGISASVTALKYDMVFLLLIKDKDFYKRNKKDFKSDYNAASLNVYPIDYILQNEFLNGKNCLAEELAGPLALLKNSKLIENYSTNIGD